MPAFRVSGATGQAPTTSFFGSIPDKFNMLAPFHGLIGSGFIWDNGRIAANNVNQWTIYNTNFQGGANAVTTSLGAMTTAPDGTSTAQHITETTTNSIHALTAGCNTAKRPLPIYPITAAQGMPYVMRLGVFAKAAERTRIVLYVMSDVYSHGCKTVFDLAGGQIGVANTAFGAGTQAAGPASIIPFGNGWYLCYMECTIGVFPEDDNTQTGFYLDNGSGTAAESSSYTGNGSSGVFAWRSTMLPVAAWGSFTGQKVFFDDFASISTIDVNNTKAPGFNFYVDTGGWPWLTAAAFIPTSSNRLSVASSKLTILGTNSGAGNQQPDSAVSSAAFTTGTSFVGQAFRAPAIFEGNFAIQLVTSPSGVYAFWHVSTELYVLTTNPPGTYASPWIEFDMPEGNVALRDFTAPLFSHFWAAPTPGPSQETQHPQINGTPVWQSVLDYSLVGEQVIYLNQIWSPVSPTVGVPPSAGPWTLVSLPPSPPAALINNFDQSQFNTYTTMWLPYTSAAQPGFILIFNNGVYTQNALVPYGPGFLDPGGNPYNAQLGDGVHQMLNFGPGANYSMSLDWVSVTK